MSGLGGIVIRNAELGCGIIFSQPLEKILVLM